MWLLMILKIKVTFCNDLVRSEFLDVGTFSSC
jgi:hypothetical protein